jgi:hypothetical protein
LLIEKDIILFKNIYRTSGVPNPNYQADAVRYATPSRMQQLQGQVDEVNRK